MPVPRGLDPDGKARAFAKEACVEPQDLIQLRYVNQQRIHFVGDAVGYYTGRTLGPRLFTRKKSLLFRPSHLQKAHEFYEKYGGKTIIIARFVPIVRTFAPIVAGAAQMSYRQFLAFNVVGGFAWVFSMILAGYFLGTVVERAFGIKLEDHIEWVVLIVVLLSLTPPLYEFLKSRREKARKLREGAGDVRV